MHTSFDIVEANRRRETINLSLMRFYDIAGIAASTWTRAVAGLRELSPRKARDIEAAIVGEEHRLLAHLVALHPDLAADLVAKLKQEEAA